MVDVTTQVFRLRAEGCWCLRIDPSREHKTFSLSTIFTSQPEMSYSLKYP